MGFSVSRWTSPGLADAQKQGSHGGFHQVKLTSKLGHFLLKVETNLMGFHKT
jgi:hypothetical protein